MKHYLSRGIIGLVVGIILGVIIGEIIHLIIWYTVFTHETIKSSQAQMRIVLFGVGGAIVVGILGLIIGLIVAGIKKTKS